MGQDRRRYGRRLYDDLDAQLAHPHQRAHDLAEMVVRDNKVSFIDDYASDEAAAKGHLLEESAEGVRPCRL